MSRKIVLIIGISHLALRIKKQLLKLDYNVIHTTVEEINSCSSSISLIENIGHYTKEIDIASVVMVYLLDDRDENNLHLVIGFLSQHPDIAVTAALFNENLIPHLQAERSNVCILNPAKIAAPSFIAALSAHRPTRSAITAKPVAPPPAQKPKERLILKLAVLYLCILCSAVTFFHLSENLSWVNSLYFVIVTISTVGYGDINLLQSSAVAKLSMIGLILSSMFFIWLIFSLTFDSLLRKRSQLALGRKRYAITDHIVVCGLGRLGYFIVEELLNKNEKVIVIESDENCARCSYFRQRGVPVYVGDGRMPKVLTDVNITQARALISVINSDSLNLEIGLNARSLNNDVRLILRIFDDCMAARIKEYLDIHFALSASAIADGKFIENLTLNKGVHS